MAFFYSFTDSLKQKWLQFYQVNRDWIRLHMEVESVYTHDGGKRPSSYLILGVANALEPKLAQLMLPFSKLNADADTLVEVLDLHFDPDIVLGHGHMPLNASTAENGDVPMISEGETITTTVNGLDNGFGEDLTDTVVDTSSADAFAQDDLTDFTSGTDEHELIPEPNGFDEPMEAVENSHNTMEADAFGDISFDENDTDSETTDTPTEMGFDNVVSDVWGDEKLDIDDTNNEMFFAGEDTSSESLDEAEIARLFPNT